MRILLLSSSLLLFAATVAGAADGAAVYKERCASRHGDTGKTDTTAGKTLKVPPLAGDANVAAMSDADLQKKIEENEKHKSFIKKLGADDVAAAAAFAKGLAGGK